MTRLALPLLGLLALLLVGTSSPLHSTSRLTPPVGAGETAAGGLLAAPHPPAARPSAASRSRVARPTVLGKRHRAGHVLEVTCYTATGNRTASGVWPRPGMAAGNRWPFGTRLHVEGIGVVTITDRIGWGSELDLFFTSERACRRFGRQHLRVAVVR